MKAAFLTLGCKLNYAETSTYERGFVSAGVDVVGWKQKADLYLINTCSVTETADSKSRNLIRKVHRVNPEALIVVTGCSAQLRRDTIEAIEGVTRVYGCDEKHLVVPETLNLMGMTGSGEAGAAGGKSAPPTPPPVCDGRSPHFRAVGGTFPPAAPASPELSYHRSPVAHDNYASGNLPASLPSPETANNGIYGAGTMFGAYSSGERTRSFLKVQDGCDNFCRYCTVPYARGRSRNIPICEAVRYANEIASQGIVEIVLTGVNTGDFGRSTGETFSDLLKALNDVEGIERYRISSIEPNLLTHEIIDWIASGTKFQPHFHIPLQTGSDALLSAMGRRYDTALFRERIEYIRAAMERPGRPKVFFGIDVMVGLPGETDELFRETYGFISSIHPAFIHVFPYSRRPGTPASVMPGQVDERTKKERVAALEELSSRLYESFVEENRGVSSKVLFESKEKDGTMSGFTENYIRISEPYDPGKVGKVLDVTI